LRLKPVLVSNTSAHCLAALRDGHYQRQKTWRRNLLRFKPGPASKLPSFVDEAEALAQL